MGAAQHRTSPSWLGSGSHPGIPHGRSPGCRCRPGSPLRQLQPSLGSEGCTAGGSQSCGRRSCFFETKKRNSSRTPTTPMPCFSPCCERGNNSICAKAQLDGCRHDLGLRGTGAELLRGLLGHVAQAHEERIQGFGHLGKRKKQHKNGLNMAFCSYAMPCPQGLLNSSRFVLTIT